MSQIFPELHKKVLFLLSLPESQEFQQYAQEVEDCSAKLRQMGVETGSISSQTLQSSSKYDVVIVVSHLDEACNCLQLSDGVMDIASFVDSLPQEFSGILDFSSCYSAQWIAAIKSHCPNCHVLGSKQRTTLPYRLFVYPYVLQLFISDGVVSYEDAYINVQEVVKGELLNQSSEGIPPVAVKLGQKMSSVYAPSTVVQDQPFIVQLFLYDSSISSDEITIQAQRYDHQTNLIETQRLPIKIKKGDIVSVGFSTFTSQPECFTVDAPVKQLRWNGCDVKFQFNAIVNKSFRSGLFSAKLIIEVNHQPVGECSFSIRVSDSKDDAPAQIQTKKRDIKTDAVEARNESVGRLKEYRSKIQNQIDSIQDNLKRDFMQGAINTCDHIIQMFQQRTFDEPRSRRRKVFVSSTCEDFMMPLRKTVESVIRELRMEPDMCDDWPQSGNNPTDLCCQRVFDSDIYLGIIGGRYGYIEPSLDTSMTQMEYYAAKCAQKPILIFILNPLNNSSEPDYAIQKRDSFIANLRSSRNLSIFSNQDELKNKVKTSLLDIISPISNQ